MSSEMAPFYRPYGHIETAGILSSLQNVVISRKQCKRRRPRQCRQILKK